MPEQRIGDPMRGDKAFNHDEKITMREASAGLVKGDAERRARHARFLGALDRRPTSEEYVEYRVASENGFPVSVVCRTRKECEEAMTHNGWPGQRIESRTVTVTTTEWGADDA